MYIQMYIYSVIQITQDYTAQSTAMYLCDMKLKLGNSCGLGVNFTMTLPQGQESSFEDCE